MSESRIEMFVNEDATGEQSVALVLCEASIAEYEDELVPCFTLTPAQARGVAATLTELADLIES